MIDLCSVPKRALVCGVSGQDGAYLSQLLLKKGYEVWGTSRDAQGGAFFNLQKLEISQNIKMISMVPEDFMSVLFAVQKSDPAEIYYLAGQSSVGLSFEQPRGTIQSAVIGPLNILEACRIHNCNIRFYHAGSSECFGDCFGVPSNEATSFNPRSPYAVGKSSAFWLVNNYREAYGLYACSGILFNHESPLRQERFVTQKIVRAVKRIVAGSSEKLCLGRLDIKRDWGWAPEYVVAMWSMLQLRDPEDFVIATGTSISLEKFVEYCFSYYGLDWHDYVVQDLELYRPTDILNSVGDPSKAKEVLNWAAEIKGELLVEKLLSSV